MSALWNVLYQKNPRLLRNHPYSVTPDMTFVDQPKVQIIYHDAKEVVPEVSATTG